MDKKSFLASPSHLDESLCGVEEDPSDSPWRVPCSSPRSGRSRIKVGVLRTWGSMNFSPLINVNTSFRCVHLFQFLNVCDHNVSFPDSPRVQRISKEYTWQDFWAELMDSRQVLSRNRLIFHHRSKRNNRAFKWYSDSLPSDKRSVTFRR